MLTTVILSPLVFVWAVPTQTSYDCDISRAKLDLLNTQSISIPDTVKPEYIALAIGTQNYTCSNTRNYSSDGALSILLDVSCLYRSDPKLFRNIQNSTYDLLLTSGSNAPSLHEIKEVTGYYPYILGDHYFIPQDGTIAPMFDFMRSQDENDDSSVVGRQLGGIPSPEGSRNINWLLLEGTDGHLARYIFRVDTQGGQPPESCHQIGQKITVPYTAKYWFFN
ncbi:hypothetical protein OPQ81_003235 [Rhizoctonia solani]|nr:hypothetical protein OPQ81_003235 [Rhizoctonia solani]